MISAKCKEISAFVPGMRARAGFLKKNVYRQREQKNGTSWEIMEKSWEIMRNQWKSLNQSDLLSWIYH